MIFIVCIFIYIHTIIIEQEVSIKMFYNPNFEFDEIDMIKIPECAFNDEKFTTNELDELSQYPIDTEYLENPKIERNKKPNRRNLSNWVLNQISKEFLILKNNTKIDIVEEEEDIEQSGTIILEDESQFSNSLMLPSRRILPVWKLDRISKDFMKTNVCSLRRKKTHKQKNERNKKSTIAIEEY